LRESAISERFPAVHAWHKSVSYAWTTGDIEMNTVLRCDERARGLITGGPTAEPMTVLVIDDTAFDKRLVGQLLKSLDGIKLLFASNGRDGLAIIDRESPAVVLTDLTMPEMDGLELVRTVRLLRPLIPVVLMTAHGSEDVAMEALRAGAANYIPKRHLVRDLVQTIRKVLAIVASRQERGRTLGCVVRRETAFVLENDEELIIPTVSLVNEELQSVETLDPTGRMQVCVALQEALGNAIFHGNLEVSSGLRQEHRAKFVEQADLKRAREPYSSRRVRLHAQIDRDSARFLVADDGPGYDTGILRRPIEPNDLNHVGGRGLLLIRTLMDQVTFNKAGSEITMVKLASTTGVHA
jgi:CheY-like chemotaxis protein